MFLMMLIDVFFCWIVFIKIYFWLDMLISPSLCKTRGGGGRKLSNLTLKFFENLKSTATFLSNYRGVLAANVAQISYQKQNLLYVLFSLTHERFTNIAPNFRKFLHLKSDISSNNREIFSNHSDVPGINCSYILNFLAKLFQTMFKLDFYFPF